VASLAPLLDLLPDERLQALLRARSSVTVPEPARPFLLAALVRHLGSPVLAITARQEEAEQLARDIHAFLGRTGADVFPGWEVLPGEKLSPSVETMGRRMHVLSRLAAGDNFVVVTTSQGITQLVAPPGDAIEPVVLSEGASVDLGALAERLVEMGDERTYIVERRGEFAIRGGIIDVFPPASERPVRAELWGDEVSTLRQFALASQRSLEPLESVSIAPCRELRADQATMDRAAELAERSSDPELHKLAEGVIEAGAERLLPLLTGGLKPVPAFMPASAPVAILEP
jgi:transcription-repair coupling factor (superfamily II helicase)